MDHSTSHRLVLARSLLAIAIATTVALGAGCAGLGGTRSAGAEPAGEQPPIDFRQVLGFARLADAAYLEPAAIQQRFAGRRVVVRDLPASKIRYFVLYDDEAKRQDIAIRGTSNLVNVRVDAEFDPAPDVKTGLFLHRGFAGAAREIHTDILPHLERGWATTLTGHSLGGAAAAIVGIHLAVDGFEVRRVITFGQPKVTNAAGAKLAAALPILRFVNATDPVAEVPPLVSLSNSNWVYTHFGPEVVLSANGRYAYHASHQAMKTSVLSFWQNLGSQSVDAHRMAAYLAQIEQAIQRTAPRMR